MTPRLRLLPFAFLALATPASAQEDYGSLRVLDTTTVKMMAGPAMSAASLSPDGSKILHLHGAACLYAVAQVGSWARLDCIELTRENRLGLTMDMTWSPDGTSLLRPTYDRARNRFQDTDIELVDPVTLTTRNLTDDNFDGSLKGGPANFDITPRWLDAATIVFVRYAIGPEGLTGPARPTLMAIGVDGSDLRTIAELPTAVHAIAPSADGTRIAYSVEDPKDEFVAGIWTIPAEGSAPAVRIAEMAEIGAPPASITFSADGTKLLVMSRNNEGYVDARVLDVESSTVTPVASDEAITGAAWSPAGSALAYVTFDTDRPEMPGGLFITDQPGKPGRLMVGGAFMAPACCGEFPFVWATDNTILLTGIDDRMGTVTLVRLGSP